MSPPSPLMSQFDDIPKDYFCKEECRKLTDKKPCNCANIFSIPSETVVDMIIYDTGIYNILIKHEWM